MSPDAPAREANPWTTPLRNLGLTIAGTALEPIIQSFQAELRQRSITRVQPRFYLSLEWGVPFGTVNIAIPFYLARPDLTQMQADRTGLVEGVSPEDIRRYLRHEMGHVVNYAYRLYEEPEWVRLFGDIDQPYEEEYHPRPFSRRFVRHLPGWYAQKHPDEDWAETFAVWLTPGLDWRTHYAGWPLALEKLNYCDATMARLRDQTPRAIAEELDEDVGELDYSLEQYYQHLGPEETFPAELEEALRGLFADFTPTAEEKSETRPAAALIRKLQRPLQADVYRWTGHFPERTRLLVRHLASWAEQRGQLYRADREPELIVALTTFVTALAMNHVLHGAYYS
jgi:hypothetical protein